MLLVVVGWLVVWLLLLPELLQSCDVTSVQNATQWIASPLEEAPLKPPSSFLQAEGFKPP